MRFDGVSVVTARSGRREAPASAGKRGRDRFGPLRREAVAADRAAAQKLLDVARRLAQALAVLDERDADIVLAVLAESHARRDRDIGML